MTAPSLARLSAVLQDASQPLDARFRTLFALKGLTSGDQDGDTTRRVIDIIDGAFANNDSALLKHELAYVLGQIGSEAALPCLSRVLEERSEHPMVRHEAAEAMGAISSAKALPVLQRYLHDANVSVRETCELALQKIQFDQTGTSAQGATTGQESEGAALARAKAAVGSLVDDDADDIEKAFLPIDPAPAHSFKADTLLSSIPLYEAQLTAGDSLPLFARYRAMFSLRNAVHAARRKAQQPNLATHDRAAYNSKAVSAIQALAAGLQDKSALFRHEICFVFGELAHPASVDSMVAVLSDDDEEEMVRHEAAEALGAVAEEAEEAQDGSVPTGKVTLLMDTLKRWANDDRAPRVVRESCIVALDEMAYNNDPTQFQPVEIDAA